MIRKFVVLAIVTLLTVTILAAGIVIAQGPEAGADGIGDPYFPRMGNGGYDVQHYTLDLNVDVEKNRVSGTATLELVTLQELSTFNLDLVGLDVEDITINGETVDYDINGAELIVIPLTPLAADETITVAVTYGGVPEGVDVSGIPFLIGWVNYGNGIFVASEPAGAASWYPVNDHPLDKATYTFRITVPEPYVVAANGVLEDTIDNGDTLTYVWEARDPIASYLVTVNIADFVRQDSEGPDGLPIRNYFPPDIADLAEKDFADTATMIEVFTELFGPYPFEAYGVVVADSDFPFALETQTLSLFSRAWISGTGAAEEAIAHELVHQWYGDSVSPASWADVWLNEGFATYGSWLWFESQGRSMDEIVTRVYTQVAQDGTAYFIPPGNPPADDLFNRGVYWRGALVLHALRDRVGDDVFFDILRTYYQRYQYSTAAIPDFIAVAEELSGEDLAEFFDGWLYDEVMPDIASLGLSVE